MLGLLSAQARDLVARAISRLTSPRPKLPIYWTDRPYVWSRKKGGYWRPLESLNNEPTEELVAIEKEAREGDTQVKSDR